MVGGGVFRLEPGQWTDDTSMALCLADSLLALNRYDSYDVMERYDRWRRTGTAPRREPASTSATR